MTLVASACAIPHWLDARAILDFHILNSEQGDIMSDFWGFPGADIVAVVVIVVLSSLALYQARTFVTRL